MERELLTSKNEKHVNGFFCGKEVADMSDYLCNEAINDNEVKTYIYFTTERKPVAYFALSCGSILLSLSEDEPVIHRSLPSVLIDKFAVADEYHHLQYDHDIPETLSQMLMYETCDFIEKIAREIIGAKYILLYATPNAHNFYLKCGFSDFKDMMVDLGDPRYSDCIPMFRQI